ncbi:exosortase-associated protein EpsI, B-type [Rhodoferax saidenbachensis]|uniref:EpsI family protein n=1 Tax=Rhodoferax saidenbachensis TaxID=1484693 RepID=A0ABU1ZL60_9BURK|nr:exosortase-associated protein EpsI, B-type [Rhodoferax saidenbachensis]MDR7305620.1 EpsI family protein [Rhodoferax saidenbachensis]
MTSLINRAQWAMLTLMVLAAVAAWRFTPTILLADKLAPIHLDAVVPSAFGDWKELTNQAAQIVDPSRQKLIDEIYTETLSRTYVNAKGYRIMLAIAYGRDQRDSLQLHQPEVCYPAQGFTLLGKHTDMLPLPQRNVAITRIETRLGNRAEPVTYWTMVGETVFRGGINKKLGEMQYGRQGYIPDGMLVRISSIDPNNANAYQLQKQFASDLVQALPPAFVKRFAGPENSL